MAAISIKSHGERSLVGYSSWGHRVGHDLVLKVNDYVLDTLRYGF